MIKKYAKRSLYRFFCLAGIDRLIERMRSATGRNHATILNFHRVTDEIPENGLTIGVAKFRGILRLLKRDFQVIELQKLLLALRDGIPFEKGWVVITFDDGYEDNYMNAYPALMSEGFPATFFITTGFIDSDKRPWWEVKKGYRSKWMTWSQVRALHHNGFDIGSHTVNHIDLGACNQKTAKEELKKSKTVIEEKIGRCVRHFAYPYGGEKQITETVREMARACGYQCCLSAFGGHVFMKDKSLYLKRTPVNGWIGNAEELGLEIKRLSTLWAFGK